MKYFVIAYDVATDTWYHHLYETEMIASSKYEEYVNKGYIANQFFIKTTTIISVA